MEENVDFDALLDQEDITQDNGTNHIDDFDPVGVDSLVDSPVDEPGDDPVDADGGGNPPQDSNEPSDTPDYTGDAMYTFLQARGLKDPGKFQISDEDGNVEEVDFKTLTPEEQLEILNELTDPGLTEEEINTVNFLRKNGLNMQSAMEAYAQQYLNNYLQQNPDQVKQRTYEIDDYSDDDLYIVDLKRRYPNFTDEEILAKLDSAKENEDLYKKETEILRNAYKEQEDLAEQDKVQAEQQAVEDLRNNLIDAASAFNEVQLDYTDANSDSLVIEDSDKQKMLSYILDTDTNGKTQLVKDLENPDALIELAWLRTQGAEVLSNITQYWKGLLAEERAENKKLRSQLEKVDKKDSNPTVIVPKKNDKKNLSIDDVWGSSI